MPPSDMPNVGQTLLNVPMGEMIKSIALSIAQAQWSLDKSSMTVAELMSGQRLLRDLDTGRLIGTDGLPAAPGAQPTVIDSRVYFGYTYEVGSDKAIKRVPQKVSMIELGFTPTFYQFVETVIEVKISVTITGTTEDTRNSQDTSSSVTNSSSVSWGATGSWWGGWSAAVGRSNTTAARASTVDASYSSKYSYSIEGSSLLRTKLVPVPPPAILEDRIRQVMADGDAWRAAALLMSNTTGGLDLDNVVGTTADEKAKNAAKVRAILGLPESA